MDKKEALNRLAALEEEAAKLRQIIEAQEMAGKKPLLPETIRSVEMIVSNGSVMKDIGTWQSYAEAFNTLLDLRRQPGSEAAVDGKEQWSITGDGEIAEGWSFEIYKITGLCPWFDSEASALAAKEAVGWDRIKRMMDTLHGRTE